MGKVRLLDCTLRDGAYLIDKEFGDPVIKGMISGLMDAHLEYIEIGFFQDEGFGPGKTVYRNAADAARFVPKDKKGISFTVLADYSRFSPENLDENPGNSIDIIRDCFFRAERFGAIESAKAYQAKGYRVFIQPVDILGYSDEELIDLIDRCNEILPECFSIVDTFGSMYEEDLERVFSLIHAHLRPEIRIGFHSHNNMQLSNALSQSFLRMAKGKHDVVVDGTISGMGRGAGNTPTELIAQYMVSKMGCHYDMDAILDVTDTYVDNFHARAKWGYSTPYFLAGAYSAHVNNIHYLTQKNSIRSKDIRFILDRMGASQRKRYPYELVESIYMDYLRSDIDDSKAIAELKEKLQDRNVVVIAPGRSAADEAGKVQEYIHTNDAVVITVNFLHETIPCDYVYMSNTNRYQSWSQDESFKTHAKILTSNLGSAEKPVQDENAVIVSFTRLIKCGWERPDNSTIMLLRLLDLLDVKSVGIAGLDGYSYSQDGKANYVSKSMELSNVTEDPAALNREIESMLVDYVETRKGNEELKFVTKSRFAPVLSREE